LLQQFDGGSFSGWAGGLQRAHALFSGLWLAAIDLRRENGTSRCGFTKKFFVSSKRKEFDSGKRCADKRAMLQGSRLTAKRREFMGTVESAIANFERNIEAQTGKPVTEWVHLTTKQEFKKHGEMVTWLKSAQGLSHSHANHIAKQALLALTPPSSDAPEIYLFEGGKEALRPLYLRLVATIQSFGRDVEIAPKKANVSIRRRKQFALLQPSTRTRLDLGLVLKGKPACGRLELSGSFNAMFTHRVKILSEADLDAELREWLKEAYDGAL
jgi:hypothetical protein